MKHGILFGVPKNCSFLVSEYLDSVKSLSGVAPLSKRSIALKHYIHSNIHSARILLLSGELIGHVLEGTQIVGFLDYLSRLLELSFSTIRVVTYLKRQDLLAVSLASTMAREGKLIRPFAKPPFSYLKTLTYWERALGRESILVSRLQKQELHKGDVVYDILHKIVPESDVNLSPVESAANPSLSQPALAFLSDLASAVSARHAVPIPLTRCEGWHSLSVLLDKYYAGMSWMPSRADAQNYMQGVHNANRIVASWWFNEDSLLFTQDYSMYPEVPVPYDTDVNARYRISLDLIANILLNGALG